MRRSRLLFERAAEILLRESGCTVRRYRSGTTGCAYTDSDDWGIEVPEPRGPVSFATFAHEVGHQLMHRDDSIPRWIEEVEAWEFALGQFDRFGLPGKQRAEDDAARCIGWAFLKAVRRSRGLARVIFETYPQWWERAETVDADATWFPSMSEERRALDAR